MGRAFFIAFVALVGIEHKLKRRRWEANALAETTKDVAIHCGKQGLSLVVATSVANMFNGFVNR